MPQLMSSQANPIINIAYWIAFGPHGPRAMDPPGSGWKIFGTVVIAFVASWFVFALIRSQAKPPPRTMNREWQEASNEYLKVGLTVVAVSLL